MDGRKELGKQSEQLARQYLERRGYRLVEANFHCRWGEIDLILKKGQELVFAEVRSRSNLHYGTPAESVDEKKRAKLRKAAQYYLYCHPDMEKYYCRFDVLSVLWEKGHARIVWLADAFQ